MTRILPLPIILAAATLLAAAAPADAAKRSCLRGGAKLVATDGGTRVVHMTVRKRERWYACWAKTGARVRVADALDVGLDNIARIRVEIVQGRYVGVREHNEGGVSESIQARIYDARTSKLLHTSAECDKVDQGDFGGVTDVAFLDGGGMAMTCDRLLLYRKAGSALETIEPAGTWVRQLGVSRYSHQDNQRLFWTVMDRTMTQPEVTKSLAL